MKSRIFMLIAAVVLSSVLLGACNMPTRTPAFIPPANVPNIVPQVGGTNGIVTLVGSPVVAPPGISRTIHVYVAGGQGSASRHLDRPDFPA